MKSVVIAASLLTCKTAVHSHQFIAKPIDCSASRHKMQSLISKPRIPLCTGLQDNQNILSAPTCGNSVSDTTSMV